MAFPIHCIIGLLRQLSLVFHKKEETCKTKQVVPILREYVKDGILDATENLVPLEHSPAEIFDAGSGEEQVTLLSENIMLYVKEFGNLTKSNATIDNEYVGKFMSGRPDRSDSHQLLAYVLLTGVQRCGFILPGNKTEVREMITSHFHFLSARTAR